MSQQHSADYSYEVITQTDPETGDILVSLPPELMATMEWNTGDNLVWALDKTGRLIVQRG